MVSDTISDMLTRIRNASLVKNDLVFIPFTQINEKICSILVREGLLESLELAASLQKKKQIKLVLKYVGRKKKACITNLRRISKTSLRIYTNHKEIPKLLGGIGIVILSTSKGILTDREARFYGVGGEILCTIW
jgi:small subunit ribosomal protein S8